MGARERGNGGAPGRAVKKAALVLLTCLAPVAAGESVVVLRDNGPSANRINLAILGDGYTSREQSRFATNADYVIAGMFGQQPYTEYASYFNVRRVDVISRESGADKFGQPRDTALGATYECRVAPLCVDDALANAVLARSLPADQRDMVLVLVNDPAYGGYGGPITVSAMHDLVVELALHELGHSFGRLVDEYEGQGTCNANREPTAANATLQTARDLIKWSHWIGAGTPVPTTDTLPSGGTVGLYAGGNHCLPSSGMYRPSFLSKMRQMGRPFEAVNVEQLVKRVYGFVSPIDRARPEEAELTRAAGEAIELSVEPMRPTTHALEIAWSIDGEPSGQDPILRIEPGALRAGTHAVEVEVRDPTPLVRSDPNQALRERRTWKLNITR